MEEDSHPILEKRLEGRLPNPLSELCPLPRAGRSTNQWPPPHPARPQHQACPSPSHQKRTPGPSNKPAELPGREESPHWLVPRPRPAQPAKKCACLQEVRGLHKKTHWPHAHHYSKRDDPHLTYCFLHFLNCHQAGSRQSAGRNLLRSSRALRDAHRAAPVTRAPKSANGTLSTHKDPTRKATSYENKCAARAQQTALALQTPASKTRRDTRTCEGPATKAHTISPGNTVLPGPAGPGSQPSLTACTRWPTPVSRAGHLPPESSERLGQTQHSHHHVWLFKFNTGKVK